MAIKKFWKWITTSIGLWTILVNTYGEYVLRDYSEAVHYLPRLQPQVRKMSAAAAAKFNKNKNKSAASEFHPNSNDNKASQFLRRQNEGKTLEDNVEQDYKYRKVLAAATVEQIEETNLNMEPQRKRRPFGRQLLGGPCTATTATASSSISAINTAPIIPDHQRHTQTEEELIPDPHTICKLGACQNRICTPCPRGSCRHEFDCSYKGEFTVCRPSDDTTTKNTLKGDYDSTMNGGSSGTSCTATCHCEPGSCDSDKDCVGVDQICHGGWGRPEFHVASFRACNGICRGPYDVLDPNDLAPPEYNIDVAGSAQEILH